MFEQNKLNMFRSFFQCESEAISQEARVACVKLIITEHSQFISNSKRDKFLKSFQCWNPRIQCYLITDLKDIWTRNQSRQLLEILSMSFIQNVNSLMSSEMLIDFLSLFLELHEKGIDDVIDIFATILKLPITKYPEGFLRELVPTFEEIDPLESFLFTFRLLAL